MKRTPEDELYAREFGLELQCAYELAKSSGTTDQKFAESIGVERPQLRKYFRGEAVPSVRTVAFAFRQHGINVSYAGSKLGKRMGSSRRKRSSNVYPSQLRLPFSVYVSGGTEFEVELKSIKPARYELRVNLKQKVG